MKMPRHWRAMQLKERANLPVARTVLFQRDIRTVIISRNVVLIQTMPR